MASFLDASNSGPIAGVTVGIVTANEDPQGLGRVKLQVPSVLGEQETGWARVVAPIAGERGGMLFVPALFAEVLVAFENGDVRYPFVLGSLWSERNKPSFAEGKPGRVVLSLGDGKTVTIDDHGVDIDDGANLVRLDANAGAVTITARDSLTLKATTITIEAASDLQLKAGQLLDASASLVKIN